MKTKNVVMRRRRRGGGFFSGIKNFFTRKSQPINTSPSQQPVKPTYYQQAKTSASNTFQKAKTVASNAASSAYNNRSNLSQSVKDIASSGKYLFSLIANPSNVHRMLFKNAYFIKYIPFEQIQRLYCNQSNPKCIKLEKGYLYSNNQQVIQSAEQAQINDDINLEKEINETQGGEVPPDEKKAIDNLVINIEKESYKYDEKDMPVSNYIDKTFKRLAFAKLNDAILTDNPDPNNPKFITFENQDLFEFLHTYKYQVNRCLWYAGWPEWVYITDKVNDLMRTNVDFGKGVLDELWGTREFFKGMSNIKKEYYDKIVSIGKKGLNELNSTLKDISDNATKIYEKQKKEMDIEMKDMSMKGGALNMNKYRVYRILLKFYDIDIGEYNLNFLKRSGILSRSYPSYTYYQAVSAVKIAINIAKRRPDINLKSINIAVDDIDFSDISLTELESLDKLIDELLTYYKYSPRGGKTRKRTKRGGSGEGFIVFFYNLHIIFNEVFKKQVSNNLDRIDIFMKQSPDNTHYVSGFFAEIIRSVSMMTITLCMTLANYALYTLPIPVSMPHCMISNLMYMYILFKLRLVPPERVDELNQRVMEEKNKKV